MHEIAAVDLSKIYFLKNVKKTCKPKNRDLNRDWNSSTNPAFSELSRFPKTSLLQDAV